MPSFRGCFRTRLACLPVMNDRVITQSASKRPYSTRNAMQLIKHCVSGIVSYYGTLPIFCSHYIQITPRWRPIACPKGRGIGCIWVFEVWPNLCFRFCCDISDLVLFWTSSIVFEILRGFGFVRKVLSGIFNHIHTYIYIYIVSVIVWLLIWQYKLYYVIGLIEPCF